MELVRCINERKANKGQLVVGNIYWMDVSTTYKDSDGDEYAKIYLDEAKTQYVGNMLTSHFEIVYRYLNYGSSLSIYINTNIGFLLKDIIGWCLNNSNHSLAEHLILYIHDNKLDIPENMEKEFVVNSKQFREFAGGMEEEYMKYMGYSVEIL